MSLLYCLRDIKKPHEPPNIKREKRRRRTRRLYRLFYKCVILRENNKFRYIKFSVKIQKRLVPMITLIWVRRFWNQNFTCLAERPNCLLSSCLCFSSGCGDSLNNLTYPCQETILGSKRALFPKLHCSAIFHLWPHLGFSANILELNSALISSKLLSVSIY